MSELLPYPPDMSALPEAKHWGWTDDRCLQYLHPDGYLTATGLPLEYRPPSPGPRNTTVKHAGGEYNRSTQAGTWEGWLEAAHVAADYPHAYSALYTSIASLLLPILEVDNFGMELCSMTSTGKTTALHLAMSAWGDYYDLYSCWGDGASHLYKESCQGSVPRTRDEAQLATTKSLKNWVYSVSAGRFGSSRWRSTFFSAGETPAGDRTKMPGIYARVVSLRGPPFGHDTARGGEAAEEVNQICRYHYGHLSVRMASYMVEYHDRLYPALKAAFIGRFNELVQRQSSGAFRRHARYLAAIHVAGDLAHSLGLPRPRSSLSPPDLLYRSAVDCSGCADLPRRAFVHMCLFLRSRQENFLQQTVEGYTSQTALRFDYPTEDLAGIWDYDNPSWKRLSVLRGFLHRNKASLYTWQARYTDTWEARGYIVSGTARHLKAAKKLHLANQNRRQHTFAVTRSPVLNLSGFHVQREEYERALEEAPTTHPVLSAQYPS